MTHPLVLQLRFTRSEFIRGIKGVTEKEGSKRFLPMNCISWNVGHLAWQEQRYFLGFGLGISLFPEIEKSHAYGAPASTPSLKEMLAAWKQITTTADPFLDTLTSKTLAQKVLSNGKEIQRTYGNLIQRTIYHYWYHLGENMAIRQNFGHKKLPQFVGSIDTKAPYQPG